MWPENTFADHPAHPTDRSAPTKFSGHINKW